MSSSAASTWQLGNLTVSNRILMAPVKTAFGDPSGKANDRHTAYFKRRAQGGTGLIILEPMFVDPKGKEHPKQLGLHDDNVIDPLRSLVSEVQRAGAMVAVHLNHAGRAANPKASGATPEAPTPIPCPATGATPEELSQGRIIEIVNAFGDAARRAVEAGVNAIELQFGLGYLVAQFWSERTNSRNDLYGGSPQNRRRFADEILSSVKAAVGENLPIVARISAEEKVEGGLDLEDTKEMIVWLEQRGIAAVHIVSGSACDSPPWYYQHMSLPPRANLELAAKLRSSTSLPIIVAGRMDDAELIEEALKVHKLDAVALGRPLVADPDFANKLFAGEPERIAQCGSCLQGCLFNVKVGKGIGCIINPEVGEEGRSSTPSKRTKKVVVVGGGPAGMQAAVTARQRGHDVILFEAQGQLGGQFRFAPLSPGKSRMQRPFSHLPAELERTGVQVQLSTKADLQMIQQEAPDEIILATGAVPIRLPIRGLQDALSGEEVLTADLPSSGNALVVGGGLIGVEAAELLAEKGWQVTLVELLDEIARDMEPVSRKLTLMRLKKQSVTIHRATKLDQLEQGIAVLHPEEGESFQAGPFDLVVTAVGTRPVKELAEEMDLAGIEYKLIGDASRPAQVYDAVKAGWETALEL